MELFRIRIGLPPIHMIINCEKRNMLFDSQNKLFRYRRSRIPPNLDTGSIPIRKALYCDDDPDLLTFIDVRTPITPLCFRIEMLSDRPCEANDTKRRPRTPLDPQDQRPVKVLTTVRDPRFGDSLNTMLKMARNINLKSYM